MCVCFIWTPKVCRIIACYRCWAIILPTFGGFNWIVVQRNTGSGGKVVGPPLPDEKRAARSQAQGILNMLSFVNRKRRNINDRSRIPDTILELIEFSRAAPSRSRVEFMLAELKKLFASFEA